MANLKDFDLNVRQENEGSDGLGATPRSDTTPVCSIIISLSTFTTALAASKKTNFTEIMSDCAPRP